MVRMRSPLQRGEDSFAFKTQAMCAVGSGGGFYVKQKVRRAPLAR